ncbi:MAG: META domain-containing protein [Methanolobus sp.]|nr:META domain-containing protein [Methanolobus sp.]
MRTTHKIYSLAIIFSLLTGVFLVSGCVDTANETMNETGQEQDISEDASPEGTENEVINQGNIISIQWEWTSMVGSGPDSQLTVPDPESYTLVFLPDGRYLIQADCNQGSGSYNIKENSLTLEPGPITRVYCGDQSLDGKHLASLNNVTSVAIENEQLVLYTGDNEGKMLFDNGGAFEDE